MVVLASDGDGGRGSDRKSSSRASPRRSGLRVSPSVAGCVEASVCGSKSCFAARRSTGPGVEARFETTRRRIWSRERVHLSWSTPVALAAGACDAAMFAVESSTEVTARRAHPGRCNTGRRVAPRDGFARSASHAFVEAHRHGATRGGDTAAKTIDVVSGLIVARFSEEGSASGRSSLRRGGTATTRRIGIGDEAQRRGLDGSAVTSARLVGRLTRWADVIAMC